MKRAEQLPAAPARLSQDELRNTDDRTFIKINTTGRNNTQWSQQKLKPHRVKVVIDESSSEKSRLTLNTVNLNQKKGDSVEIINRKRNWPRVNVQVKVVKI